MTSESDSVRDSEVASSCAGMSGEGEEEGAGRAGARLLQSSLRESPGPPAPPPRSSSQQAGQCGAATADLGKTGASKTTCMQCYLSGHSDGSLDSVDPSTEGSSSAETPSGGAPNRDRDSGIMEDKFERYDPDQIIIKQDDDTRHED